MPGCGKRRVGKLVELEFFGVAGVDSGLSFDKLQYHFEKTFGKPAKSKMDAQGYPSYEWRLWGVRIHHYLHDRFGMEERAFIVKT